VRYKFLKKDYTESGYIEDAVTRLALVNPNISFKLINSGKTVIQTTGSGKLEDVIYSIYGADITNSILKVDYTYEDIHVGGVVGKPEIARSNRSNQLFFVNKRYVKDKTLSSATESGFKGLLPIGKYGFLVLNIDINPAKVDVNVHPAKLEVRFEEENKVFKAVFHAIKDTLLKAELIANTEKTDNLRNYENSINQENTKTSITDLFRKIKKEEESKNDETNFIEDIYKRKEEKLQEENVTKMEEQKMDVFKELMAMQKRLKEEAENDPSLHTNIDALINNTESLKTNMEEITTSKENREDEDTSKIDYMQEVKNEDMEVKETSTPYNAFSFSYNDTIKNDLPVYNENIAKIDDITDDNKAIENNKEKEENVKQETKTFSNSEIQEMIDKLGKMDNIEKNPEFESMYEKIFGKLPPSTIEEQNQEKEKINAYELIKDDNKVSIFENISEYNKPTYKLVGIAFNTYIIIEIEKELYIIDQHAAHERVMYEKVKENYYSKGTKDSQMLLLPDILTLTHKEMDILKDNRELFYNAGFILEEFGENTMKLSGVPEVCVDLDTEELFKETLDEINTVARTAKQEKEEKFIATVACKAAVKANMKLTKEEVDSLMEQLLQLPNPFTCPHGRPTAIRMDQNDIERKFARRK
jgi:DNA mismatch repair protein MutL